MAKVMVHMNTNDYEKILAIQPMNVRLLFGSYWKGSEGIESTRKMWLVSNSEIKAVKEQVDHETVWQKQKQDQ